MKNFIHYVTNVAHCQNIIFASLKKKIIKIYILKIKGDIPRKELLVSIIDCAHQQINEQMASWNFPHCMGMSSGGVIMLAVFKQSCYWKIMGRFFPVMCMGYYLEVTILSLWFFECFHPPELRYRGCIADVSVGVGHPSDTQSMHSYQLQISVLVSIYCKKEKLL